MHKAWVRLANDREPPVKQEEIGTMMGLEGGVGPILAPVVVVMMVMVLVVEVVVGCWWWESSVGGCSGDCWRCWWL